MHFLKRLVFVVALSVVSFGITPVVSLTPAYASTVTAEDLQDLLDDRIAELEDFRDDLLVAIAAEAGNSAVLALLTSELQATNIRIANLTVIRALAPTFDDDTLLTLFELYGGVVSPNHPTTS